MISKIFMKERKSWDSTQVPSTEPVGQKDTSKFYYLDDPRRRHSRLEHPQVSTFALKSSSQKFLV